MTIIPLGNNILIEPDTENRVLASSPIEKDTGTVVSVGEEVTKLKKGDKIVYMKFGVKRVEVSETEKYLFIAEDSPWLLGKIE
jgi:co-chaperonin GroES (HSP10)